MGICIEENEFVAVSSEMVSLASSVPARVIPEVVEAQVWIDVAEFGLVVVLVSWWLY